MKDCLIKTIMAVIVLILANILVYVCNTYTVPSVAVTITLIFCGVAGWAIYRVCKIWILKLIRKWNLKEKQ